MRGLWGTDRTWAYLVSLQRFGATPSWRGETIFEVARDERRSMTFERAVAYALEVDEASPA
jgi:hypothetical protein